MTKQILAFLFCFKRELNLYPHLRARTQTFTPPLHPSLKARGFIKPSVLTLTHPPKAWGKNWAKNFITTRNVVTTKPTQVNLLNVRMYYTVRLNILPIGNIVVLDIKASENIL